MGKSSREQAGANRARILEVASGLFRSRGYDAVGIADVMKAAGMTQGGFYKHFASKEALAAEAWAFGFERAVRAWQQQANGACRLGALIDYYFSAKPPERGCPMVAHGEEATRQNGDGELRSVYARGARALYDAFVSTAKGAVDEDRARLLFAAMVGANMLGRGTGNAGWVEDLKKTVKAAVEDASGRNGAAQ